MLSKKSNEAKDLDVLQREYRNMEVNRKAFSEESHLVLRKQQQTLDKLRKENDGLKIDLASLQTRTALRPINPSEQVQIDKLQRELLVARLRITTGARVDLQAAWASR